MSSIRLHHLRSVGCRRLVTGVALAAYLMTACGLPIPAMGDKDVSVAFPCQHHACGCMSADQCWHSCCCYTPKQRLAWAREHGVAIPIEARSAMLATADSPAGRSKCCLADADDDHHCDARDHACPKCALHDEPSVAWVLGVHARKCRGLSTQWVSSGATLPIEILPLWQFDWTLVGRVFIAADRLGCLCMPPAVPPPRV
jgi:hypothetical protein